VNLSEYLLAIATGYDRHAGLRTPTQQLLRQAGDHIGHLLPGGLKVIGSGGKGTATLTPWVGVFDPDETSSPEEGLYVVYLWASDLASVTLTLLQGITTLDRAVGHAEARRRLAEESRAIRAALPAASIERLDATFELGSAGFRQLGYAAACVVATRYEFAALPPEAELTRDLSRFLRVYQDAIPLKRRIRSTSEEPSAGVEDLLARFTPKSDSEYAVRLRGGDLVKSRRHERLVAEYGRWVAQAGFAPSTQEHPCDLVLRRAGAEWLVEAKVLDRGNATDATRAAIGQLLMYRHFLWLPTGPPPHMVALFSEPIGAAYESFLEGLGIAVVWKERAWRGSTAAVSSGLAVG
jgi:hypothetical protein